MAYEGGINSILGEVGLDWVAAIDIAVSDVVGKYVCNISHVKIEEYHYGLWKLKLDMRVRFE